MTASDIRTRGRTARGGAWLVVAGLLLLVGGLPFAVGAAPERGVTAWQLLCWPVGGVVLLVATVLLAGGARASEGLVGAALRSRITMILSGAAPLLVTIVFALSWSLMGSTQLVLVVVQLLTAGATAVVASMLLRMAARTGAARWGFVAIAIVDVVALALAVVPQGLSAFQFVVALVRPLAVIAAGGLILGRRGVS